MRSMWRLVLAAACLFHASGAGAQTVTGTLFGRIQDAGGGVLPGVSVTISSPSLIGGQQVRVSDTTGEFRFPALPPGTYAVRFELAGFQTVNREGVALGAGATRAVDVTLAVSGLEETVTVVGGAPLVDTKSAQMSTVAGDEVLQNVPTGRTFVDVFNLMPGVVYGRYNVATTGTNSVHGGSVRNNVFSLDGVNVNDPLVAYPGTDVNLEVIAEVQVTTAGMSAEFGGASGAVFNVITKSGGNTLTGQVNGYLRDKKLQADNVTDDLIAQGIRIGSRLERAGDWGGSIGGPVFRDRLWYFANYQRLDDSRRIISFPEVVTGDQDAYFGKATAQVSSRHRLDGFYQYRLRYDYPFIPNVNEQDPKVWRRQRQSNHTINAKWTGTLTDTTFLEARASVANQRRFTAFPNASDDDYGYRDQNTGAISGGWYRELARPGNRNSRQTKVDVSHFVPARGFGSHDLKAGFSYDWLINKETREWLAGARVHLLFDGRPDRIQLSNAPVNQNGSVNQWAFYAQDQWTLGRLTLNLGLRYENIEGWYPEGSSGGVNFPQQTFPQQRDVLTLDNVAPRIGAVYDLLGDRQTVVRATWGRFYNQIYTSEFDAAVPFAFGSRVFRWTDLNGDRVWQPGEEGQLISDSTVPSIGRIDPGVEQSYVTSWTVGVERQIGSVMAVGATVLGKEERDIAETLDAALPFDAAYLPVTVTNPATGAPITIYALRNEFRGRPVQRFYTNPGTATCSFCPDLERSYRALELTFQKRMSQRWQLNASYVRARARGNKGQGHTESQGNVFANPNGLVNSSGRLSLDRPHQFKAQGTFELPYGVLLSASYVAQSGLPWARTVRFTRTDSPLIVVESAIVVNAEPIGSQRFDVEQDLSLRGEKRFTFGRTTLGLMVDVFNVFNLSTVTSVQQTRIDLAAFGRPGEILNPRTVRLGARLQF